MSCTSTTTIATSKKVKTSKLSATSPVFIPGLNLAFDPKTNKILSTTKPRKQPRVVSSTQKPLPNIPKVWFPNFNERPPIPTPNESLSKWRSSNYGLASIPEETEQRFTCHGPAPPAKRDFSFMTQDEYFGAAMEERREREEKARRAQEEGLKAVRTAMRLHKLNRAGIIVKEEKITNKDIWLWEHPTLGAYRCPEPSPLRTSMTFKN